MRTTHLLTSILAVGLALSPLACNKATPPDGAAQSGLVDRDPVLARNLVAEGALLLDVRTGSEFESGSISGARNIPHDEMAQRIDEILELQGGDKHKPIVLFCRSGARADKAKGALTSAGFDQVTNLGGVDDWPAQ
ncbi:MAG: rhodanese-like domain-containing protein [bacterium]|nr:rhodanese-like domain-containing protein [bacterium]